MHTKKSIKIEVKKKVSKTPRNFVPHFPIYQIARNCFFSQKVSEFRFFTPVGTIITGKPERQRVLMTMIKILIIPISGINDMRYETLIQWDSLF